MEEARAWSDIGLGRQRWIPANATTRTERKSHARVAATRDLPGKQVCASDLDHGAATTEPLETSTSRRRRRRSPFPLPRPAPDTPTSHSVSLYPTTYASSSLIFALCRGFSPSGLSSPFVSLSTCRIFRLCSFPLTCFAVLHLKPILCPEVCVRVYVCPDTFSGVYLAIGPV